jgi:hypothetical protein
MKKLLKEYGFNSDIQYFEMIVESVINGKRTQAREQFNAMPRKIRKNFIVAIYAPGWQCGYIQELSILSDMNKANFYY